MTTPAVSVQDGPRITVNDFLQDPLRIPQLVLDMTRQNFIADALLRPAGPVTGGAVRFDESTPLFADRDAAVRAEFGEVPTTPTSTGQPRISFVEERALAVMISDEMTRRYDVDPVTRQLAQVRNTLTRSWDDTFIGTVTASTDVHTQAASGLWSEAATDIRADLIEAMRLIESSTLADQPDSLFNFTANTLVVHTDTKSDLLKHEDFNKIYQGNTADENLLYTGKLPNQIYGMDVLVSRRLPRTKVLVMERSTCGFIADELPLQASPLYRDEPRKVWRSDVQRASAIGLDQPKAITVIDGVAA